MNFLQTIWKCKLKAQLEYFINVVDHIADCDFPEDNNILQNVTSTELDEEDNDDCDAKTLQMTIVTKRIQILQIMTF